MVEREIDKDIAKTDNKYAKLLKGRVARKVVKQTVSTMLPHLSTLLMLEIQVMTTVYGVTFIGAREQIDRQLTNRGDIPKEDTWGAASYLAKKVLSCIGDLFRGAKDIQMYLNFLARLIAKSIPPERIQQVVAAQEEFEEQKRAAEADEAERAAAAAEGRPFVKKTRAGPKKIEGYTDLAKEMMTSVIWTTPLGLPVVQPYRKGKRKQVHTRLQTVYISDPNIQSGGESGWRALRLGR
jgi:DNA-directed RNA polymerase